MKVEVEQVSPVERRVSIEVPWDDVKQELDMAYRGLSKRAKIKGFRAGKVPRKLLEKYYSQTVEDEVVGRMVDDAFRKAVEEKDLFPIDNPQLDQMPTITKDSPLSFVATVEVKPEVEVSEYKGLEVERKIREVSEEEISAELEQLRQKAVVIEQIEDRNDAQKGDLAVIDFFGYVDGETFKGGKGINYTVELGNGEMIPGFEDALIGMAIGEQKVFNLDFPEGEGPEEVQGKTVEWKVDLKELKSKILPELDDEFAKDLGEYDTLAELKDKVKENLATREDAKSRRLLRTQVREVLLEKNSITVPPRMVDRQLDFMLQDALRMVQSQDSPEIREAIAKLKVEARPQAEKQVAAMLILEAVARAEGIEVSNNDIEGKIQELSREHRIPVPQLKQQLKQNDQISSIRYNMLQDKAMDMIVEAAKVTDRTVTAEEFAAAEAAAEGIPQEEEAAESAE